MTIAEQLRAATNRLQVLDAPGASPRLEAELLMAHALDRPRTYLFSHGDDSLPEAQASTFKALLERRLSGEPLAYLTGSRAFWSLDLVVNPNVLIPRPETELLVEMALQHLPLDEKVKVADLGTGSGAIALALASERPLAVVIATDVSEAALETAQLNARRHGLERVKFMSSDWLAALEGQFDLIVSNPPYVAVDDPHLDRGDCRFEPRGALTPGPDALSAYQQIITQARAHLVTGGWLMFEHGFDQAVAIRALLRTEGYGQIVSRADLQGHERVTLGRLR